MLEPFRLHFGEQIKKKRLQKIIPKSMQKKMEHDENNSQNYVKLGSKVNKTQQTTELANVVIFRRFRIETVCF